MLVKMFTKFLYITSVGAAAKPGPNCTQKKERPSGASPLGRSVQDLQSSAYWTFGLTFTPNRPLSATGSSGSMLRPLTVRVPELLPG